MTPDHYVDEMKRFARYTRNYNPAQQAPDAMKRDRRRARTAATATTPKR